MEKTVRLVSLYRDLYLGKDTHSVRLFVCHYEGLNRAPIALIEKKLLELEASLEKEGFPLYSLDRFLSLLEEKEDVVVDEQLIYNLL